MLNFKNADWEWWCYELKKEDRVPYKPHLTTNFRSEST
jgi:hypothetical protein